MINYFRVPPEKRLHARVMWIIGGVTVFCAILFFALYLCIGAQAKAVPGTDAAARWQAEDSIVSHAQLAAYFDKNNAFQLNDVYLNRMEMEKALEENSITAPEGAQPFIDAFSGETQLSVSTDRASLSVQATVCGGNFFFFHPLDLISGGYFKEGDINACTVILDEYAAWQLFGAVDVTGMEVSIGGQPFYVTGVTRAPTDEVERSAYGEMPRVFVNYTGLRLIQNYDSATCYEIVLPNPIENFAADLVKKQYGIQKDSKNAVLYDYTERFDFETLVSASQHYFERIMRYDSVVPPYWENIARVAENKAIVISFFDAVVGILTLICFVIFISLWFCIHPIRIHNIYTFFEDKIEARRMKRWLKKHSNIEAPAQSSSSPVSAEVPSLQETASVPSLQETVDTPSLP